MNWKTDLQVGDLDRNQKLEFMCKKCGHTHYITTEQAAAAPGAKFLYLDELEQKSRCPARGCGSPVRLAINSQKKMTGFVGGMA